MSQKIKTKHIGIVGCSAEGAALCYTTLCTQAPKLMGPHAHPEVSMHTHSLADYVTCLEAADLDGVAALMHSSAEKLIGMGADLLICPDNTIHQALGLIRERISVPWLHIAEVVTLEAKRLGYQQPGILGTRWLVESSVYPNALEGQGLRWQKPNPVQTNLMSDIIMDELVCGTFNESSTSQLIDIIDDLKDRDCDAVILGCTELPLVLNDDNSLLPTLNSNRLLAEAALRAALN
ncbi:aspartate/glutamate racemase family protein [Marinicella sediminis]|uniref:Aspartate/glutamate racemase family protein n=1 Tax=Marinicella sediminis TaxID=1792834 RepID=A0ABV7J922_9GAMM|nr:amino acid racemase [Marinicella sediminis]